MKLDETTGINVFNSSVLTRNGTYSPVIVYDLIKTAPFIQEINFYCGSDFISFMGIVGQRIEVESVPVYTFEGTKEIFTRMVNQYKAFDIHKPTPEFLIYLVAQNYKPLTKAVQSYILSSKHIKEQVITNSKLMALILGEISE